MFLILQEKVLEVFSEAEETGIIYDELLKLNNNVLAILFSLNTLNHVKEDLVETYLKQSAICQRPRR
jgi:hypothetical protein